MYKDGTIKYSLAKRSHEGFVLQVSASQKYQGTILLVFGLFWTLFTGAMLYGVIQDNIGLMAILPAMFLGLFVLIGLLCTGAAIAEMWKNSKVHLPELILPSYPLRLGETIAVHYRRRLRNNSFRSSATVDAELVCDEWVQYSQGTDTVTKTHTIWQQTLPEQTVDSGESQADYTTDIHIKPQGPPSFSSSHNKIRYRLIFKLHAPNMRSAYESEFSLQVNPEQIA